MNYNIVNTINRWENTGFLDDIKSPRMQLELSRYLERAVNRLIDLDLNDDLSENCGDFVITSMVEIYEILKIRVFHRSEAHI